jgi:outer membrane protein TolC
MTKRAEDGGEKMVAIEFRKLTFQIVLLTLLTNAVSFAAPPYDYPDPEPPSVPERITAPSPQAVQPPRQYFPPSATTLPQALPVLNENLPRPPFQAAPPAEEDRPLPINLATALYLSNARPLVIAFAQASVEEAAARLQSANVLWLPNLNFGVDYYRHDGYDQTTNGTIITDNKNSYYAGGGATITFAVTDAIFRPLAARQELAARQADLQAARNDALLSVANAYFDVQESRGRLAAAIDSADKANDLVNRISGLAKGLVPEIEVDRARALQYDLQQQVATARANWRITSAQLTRVLRLNPSSVVIPAEPPQLQITLIDSHAVVDHLIPVGLLNRPELSSQRMLVQSTLERLRQEQMRPLIPSLVMAGRGPGGSLNGGVFGGGPDNGINTSGGRFDFDVGVVWTLNNLGAGNRALVHERKAQEQQAWINFYSTQDQVAQDVVQAHARVAAAASQIDDAARALEEAITTFNGNLKGIAETRAAGGLLIMVNRPQEAVAALQQLSRSYDNYLAALNNYNRSQFQLYRSVGYPARGVICDHPVGELEKVDLSRPSPMAPVCPNVLSNPCPCK